MKSFFVLFSVVAFATTSFASDFSLKKEYIQLQTFLKDPDFKLNISGNVVCSDPKCKVRFEFDESTMPEWVVADERGALSGVPTSTKEAYIKYGVIDGTTGVGIYGTVKIKVTQTEQVEPFFSTILLKEGDHRSGEYNPWKLPIKYQLQNTVKFLELKETGEYKVFPGPGTKGDYIVRVNLVYPSRVVTSRIKLIVVPDLKPAAPPVWKESPIERQIKAEQNYLSLKGKVESPEGKAITLAVQNKLPGIWIECDSRNVSCRVRAEIEAVGEHTVVLKACVEASCAPVNLILKVVR